MGSDLTCNKCNHVVLLSSQAIWSRKVTPDHCGNWTLKMWVIHTKTCHAHWFSKKILVHRIEVSWHYLFLIDYMLAGIFWLLSKFIILFCILLFQMWLLENFHLWPTLVVGNIVLLESTAINTATSPGLQWISTHLWCCGISVLSLSFLLGRVFLFPVRPALSTRYGPHPGTTTNTLKSSRSHSGPGPVAKALSHFYEMCHQAEKAVCVLVS